MKEEVQEDPAWVVAALEVLPAVVPVAASAAVIEVEEATAIEVADKTTLMMMEALHGAEVLAPEAAMAVNKMVATNNKKAEVASDQKLQAHQVAVLQWSKRAEVQELWFTFPTSDSKLTNRT